MENILIIDKSFIEERIKELENSQMFSNSKWVQRFVIKELKEILSNSSEEEVINLLSSFGNYVYSNYTKNDNMDKIAKKWLNETL